MGGPVKAAHLRAVRWKVSRLQGGAAPRVLDLFAGCGGLSLGAHAAGCEIVGSVELDPIAARSHAMNFHGGAEAHAKSRNISKTDPYSLLQDLGVAGSGQRAIDVLIGGPPCQAFARVGRAKLREIFEHPEAFLHDERSGLYRDYLRFVEALSPAAVVIENVPDVLNYGGLNIFETIANALEELGYRCAYGLLNAAHYGVPQMRTRCFLIAIAEDADAAPTLPAPTHFHELPVGYSGTRDVALRHIHSLFERSKYVEVPQPDPGLARAVTAQEAIGDLPPINDHLRGLLRKVPQRLNTPIPAPASRDMSAYARLMRSWPGFESDDVVRDHAIRFLPRDYKIFRRMRPGDQYPEAYALATRMFEEALAALETTPRRGSRAYEELKAQYVPPYDANKFPNKWRKMEPDEPARTLMAHIGKDTYSHIHYDSKQARTISVREAARLQSFPDGFRFAGTMNPAFRQIGNAVPPLLAKAVLRRVVAAIRAESPEEAAVAQ